MEDNLLQEAAELKRTSALPPAPPRESNGKAISEPPAAALEAIAAQAANLRDLPAAVNFSIAVTGSICPRDMNPDAFKLYWSKLLLIGFDSPNQ